MKLIKSNLRTLAGSCLALATLILIASLGQPTLAQSQAAVAQAKPTVETRSAFATSIESQLRQRGIDARVQLDGDKRDILRIEWQGVSRRDIYGFVNSATVRDAIEPIGFKSIVFANGSQRWDYDLVRESMVWNPSQL